MNALILASDALRIANQNSGRPVFAWCLVSETGKPVRASNGWWLPVDHAIGDMPPAEVFLVFEGNLPTQRNAPELLAQLRAAARFGAIVGGIDTGAFALAQAGLVAGDDDRPLVVHWEAAPTFKERFATADIREQIFLIDGNRAHCAGGVATLDLMLELIARLAGEPLADEVANALVHSRRPPETRQRRHPPPEQAGTAMAGRIVATMEANLDFPLSHTALARAVGLSQRSLSRFCQSRFGVSPMRLYLRIRLQAARNFLFYEDFSIKDVGNACGFSFPAVFSRAFKNQFGQTPREFRTTLRASQHHDIRPEIRRLITSG